MLFTVTNWTDQEEVVEFRTEEEARAFVADTNGVLTLPNGEIVSYENGEPSST